MSLSTAFKPFTAALSVLFNPLLSGLNILSLLPDMDSEKVKTLSSPAVLGVITPDELPVGETLDGKG